ncbi:MAG: hypothetical protein JNN06_12065, partial [Gemmobacter sp.]|uniref:hypothetical protein n=1 Tax=Gemmobacter sp. TaxID=1898957 RepID=UPI001A3EF121
MACTVLPATGAAQAEGAAQAFHCTADARVEPAQREAICAGFLAELAATYPKARFEPQRGGAPGVELRILRASAAGAMLQLVW